MTTDKALIEKREELKRRLAAGEYKTLVDVFLEWFDRLIRKITRQSKPLPLWFITIILILVFTLTFIALVHVGGITWTTFRSFYGLSVLSGILFLMFGSTFGVVSIVIINQYIVRILALWCGEVIDATGSLISLEEFETWLGKVGNWRLQLFITIVGSLLNGLYNGFLISTQLGISIDYGFRLLLITVGIFGWPFAYLLFMVWLLSVKLRRFDLKLFAADPSSSQLITHLSDELGFFVYYVAIYAAIYIIFLALGKLLPSVGVALILVYWLPIIVIFILNQTSLSNIIRRAKWKTLNEIQSKIEKLQDVENFEDKEKMETINRLMDYHDRVKATRDSALDFRTYLSLFNSLLLPLLAFILGNLDLVLKLFGIKP